MIDYVGLDNCWFVVYIDYYEVDLLCILFLYNQYFDEIVELAGSNRRHSEHSSTIEVI